MDLLSGMGREDLRISSWVVAVLFAVVLGVLRPRSFHWTALGSVLLFAALNAGAGIYVLDRFRDSRWAADGEQRLSAPSFSGTPVVGEYLRPLDSALNGMVGGVNDFLAFKEALPVALDFFGAAGWAVQLSFPLAILAVVVNHFEARRRRAEFEKIRTVEFEKYRATVDQLRDELETVKRMISPMT